MTTRQPREAQTHYSVQDVARLFDIPVSRLRYWIHTGFIVPSHRYKHRRFYDFKDLLAIKVAKSLLDAGQPLQRVRRSLDALRYTLPRVDSPLARLRIRSDRDRIIVEEAEASFEAATGQLLLDFDVNELRTEAAQILELPGAGDDEGDGHADAYERFLYAREREEAWDGEDTDAACYVEARRAYERAVELDPDLAAAWTNLGILLARASDTTAARDAFDQALQREPDQPEAQCNLAELALRDGDAEIAVEGYRAVLRSYPDHAEAHYGLARGLLALGGREQAVAHLERFLAATAGLATMSSDTELASRRLRVREVVEDLRRELPGA